MQRSTVRWLAFTAFVAVLNIVACSRPQGATAPSTSSPTPLPSTSPAVPPTPTSALTLSERLRQSALLEEYGDYGAAVAELRALLEMNLPAEAASEALLRLGHCELEDGAYAQAAQTLERFLATYPDDAGAAQAQFWLAEALAHSGQEQQAAAAYRAYLEKQPILKSYVQARIGAVLAAALDHEGAAAAYRAAAEAETNVSNRVGYLEALADSLRALQRYADAVAAYDEILEVARIPDYRAQILYQAGATLQEAGDGPKAVERWREIIQEYPETAYAAKALAQLDQAGESGIDAITRARIQYATGAYEEALVTLQRYMAATPDPSPTARYYAALCFRWLGQPKEAQRELQALLQEHPESSLAAEAQYQQAEILAALGAVDQAATAFQHFAAEHPDLPRSTQALWQAAKVYEESGRSWDASAAYVLAATTYPEASYASEARFRAGFVHYRQSAVQTAAKTWGEMLAHEQNPSCQARLHLWMGKVAQLLKDEEGARQQWQQAMLADPQGFYGLRARDLLAGRAFTGSPSAGAFASERYTPRGERAEAEQWLLTWASAAPGESPGALPAEVAQNENWQRGLALWQLGEAQAATAELRTAMQAIADKPWALYALALAARDQKLYLFATSAAEQLLNLAPPEAQAQAPRFLEELAYPTYFADLIVPQAQVEGVDPLLFFALTRQESHFDPHATSAADARGLTQVIPSTGTYIAQQLGEDAFDPAELWRPVVSVRYGMWYFSSALRMFADNALKALVAYNAGPGNAAKWAEQAGGDDDLFFELVTSAEPRAYMQRIYEHRAHYEQLYR